MKRQANDPDDPAGWMSAAAGENMEAGIVNVAKMVVLFYKVLVVDGVPPPAAVTLTECFLKAMSRPAHAETQERGDGTER